jgi:hypothetical protein
MQACRQVARKAALACRVDQWQALIWLFFSRPQTAESLAILTHTV